MPGHGDEPGLRRLAEMIDGLVRGTKAGHFEHSHVMTPAWGGHQLSSENKGGKVINHVKLYCWKGETEQKSYQADRTNR